jgi:hypothetical protein
MMDLSRISLIPYDWTMESFLWNYYPNCRDSHILGAAILVKHSPMPARLQAAR